MTENEEIYYNLIENFFFDFVLYIMREGSNGCTLQKLAKNLARKDYLIMSKFSSNEFSARLDLSNFIIDYCLCSFQDDLDKMMIRKEINNNKICFYCDRENSIEV